MHAATKSDCPVQICSISNWASWIIRLPTVLGRSGTFSRILPWRLVARRRLVTRILASCFLFLVVAVAVHDDNDCLWSNVRLVSLSFAFIDFRICKNEWSRTWRMLIFFFRNSGQDENRRTSRMLASKLLSSISFHTSPDRLAENCFQRAKRLQRTSKIAQAKSSKNFNVWDWD